VFTLITRISVADKRDQEEYREAIKADGALLRQPTGGAVAKPPSTAFSALTRFFSEKS
jgi:hypothetical protein